jgi:hypothetical protein
MNKQIVIPGTWEEAWTNYLRLVEGVPNPITFIEHMEAIYPPVDVQTPAKTVLHDEDNFFCNCNDCTTCKESGKVESVSKDIDLEKGLKSAEEVLNDMNIVNEGYITHDRHYESTAYIANGVTPQMLVKAMHEYHNQFTSSLTDEEIDKINPYPAHMGQANGAYRKGMKDMRDKIKHI